MASYFSRSLPSGKMTVGASINLFKEDANPQFAVGTGIERADGNVYRYCHFNSATARGLVVCPSLNDGAEAYNDNAVIATNSVFQQPNETTGVYASMKGSKYIAALLSSKTADQFAGGYVTISSGTGIGYTYSIKGNKASNGTACVIELYDAIQVGLDATSDIAIAPSKYNHCVAGISGTTENSLPVGVTVMSITSAGYYGWAQTKGPIGVMQSGTLVTGKLAVLSSGEPGNAEAYGLGAGASNTGSGLVTYLDAPIIGKVMLATADSGHAVIDVNLE